MANNQLALDRVFHALADPTRRTIVMRLSAEPSAVGDLFQPMPMALPTLLKHIRVLEDCGLVTTRKVGRERICEMRPEALRETDAWLSQQRSVWEARLDRMEAHVLGLQEKENKNDKRKKRK
ncbi:ArsR/SmtB family transcription factor [Hyphomonas johnsonii]|uniref:Transcriptional regulator n=1 Tax=Hyphomonas johnsonii MHS-2 TaxID=1280950 RepID=A0A059FNW4_9PROT|nr:metalloregulator ArsR/SmtB family transcription factor [Hyphomonas johnsonii]KCZ92365.1 transcriptional regulator [Hyphomonas johnsonii MHS-2]